MKKFLGFLLLLLISANAFSQANEQDINALSIFSEYVKAKNYDAAFEPWMELRKEVQSLIVPFMFMERGY